MADLRERLEAHARHLDGYRPQEPPFDCDVALADWQSAVKDARIAAAVRAHDLEHAPEVARRVQFYADLVGPKVGQFDAELGCFIRDALEAAAIATRLAEAERELREEREASAGLIEGANKEIRWRQEVERMRAALREAAELLTYYSVRQHGQGDALPSEVAEFLRRARALVKP